jgi:hypothetical protein
MHSAPSTKHNDLDIITKEFVMFMVGRLALITFLVLMGACAKTQQAREVVKAGFLDDYSILQKGEGKYQALLRYVNPITDWNHYSKVLIDPVQLWMGKSSPLLNIPREERRRLASLLFGKLQESILSHYRIVREPGPRVMRISVALTEAETSNSVLDTISSVLPTGYVTSGGKSLATGTGTYVGTASVEVKITDAERGTLLAAAVDRRGGAKTLSGVTSKWDDVEQSFQYWASLLKYRLCRLRGEFSCVKPSA